MKKTINYKIATSMLLTSVVMVGCMVGPKFKAPEVELPEQFSFASEEQDSLANLDWWRLFENSTLEDLIELALVQNKDLLVTASKVEQAMLNQKVVRADLYPYIGINAQASYGDQTIVGFKSPDVEQNYMITPTLSWELDFWGKLRHANNAAKAELVASEHGFRAVQISLVAQIASAYFELLDYERRLFISIGTFASADRSYELIKARLHYGMASRIDLNQSEIHRATAAVSIPQYRRAIVETENTIAILVGENPGIIIGRGITLEHQAPPKLIPVGIPSDLLERRPDIAQSYYQLWAATEMIGVAQAMRYPSISLTASGGAVSSDITKIFDSGSLMWSTGLGLTGPIFNFGKNKRNVEIQREVALQGLLGYENTVINALKETEDALVGIETYRSEVKANRELVDASKSAEYLSFESYKLGAIDYLDVLSSQQTLFQAQLQYSMAMKNHLNSYVNLYKALGGGWVVTVDEEVE